METSTITRQRQRHTAVGLTAGKLDQVERLSREWHRLVDQLVHESWSPQHLATVVPAKGAYSIQARRRANGDASRSPLNAHYRNTAIVAACAIVRASWEQTFAAVRSDAAKLSDSERHEINWLLRWPVHLQTILERGVVVPADKDGTPVAALAANDHARLNRWLRRKLMAHRPKQPSLRFRPTFELDATHYRVSVRPGEFPVWLSITGLTKSRPIRLPMAALQVSYSNLVTTCGVYWDASSFSWRYLLTIKTWWDGMFKAAGFPPHGLFAPQWVNMVSPAGNYITPWSDSYRGAPFAARSPCCVPPQNGWKAFSNTNPDYAGTPLYSPPSLWQAIGIPVTQSQPLG